MKLVNQPSQGRVTLSLNVEDYMPLSVEDFMPRILHLLRSYLQSDMGTIMCEKIEFYE